MKLAITGGYGFLGWHLACRLRALHGIEPIRVGRKDFIDPLLLAETLAEVDVVIHLAGVNRAATEDRVEADNIALAQAVATALGGRAVHIVYGNTIHAGGDTAYGRGKRRAAEILAALPGTLADVQLPNLFGEHGRPAYNSFVATFCHEVAHGRAPAVTSDKPVPLLHAQDAAEHLIQAALRRESAAEQPAGDVRNVSAVLALIEGFQDLYAECGELPDLSTPFAVNLFNTYRSYGFPAQFPIFPTVHSDDRGDLYETVRAHGGTGQAYVSTTVPGATRGEHYHLRKVERFIVVSGEAEISLRRLLHDEVVTLRLSGSRPAFVDMPTMWVHNIHNIGEGDLVTMFWSDQLLDPARPDQFPERVLLSGSRAAKEAPA
ncbi:NAD-dependent epimerase/dehydratase family protein [Nocardioides sp.]|uniref:polysaccharide biosynthesis C-terminal domain-containing protein n=1 Tax=Nocardioides sp. TaxID=35761 RepID=UPI002732F92F|nr:NAD-dependent epimerase/dehydratase family protein [Nocardioides sp.]MDP3893070.1 hypothetical protein [Nocardioides sp.]